MRTALPDATAEADLSTALTVPLKLIPSESLLSTPVTDSVIIPTEYSRSTGFGAIRTNFLEIAIKFKASSSALNHWVCLNTGCGISQISRSFLARVMPLVKFVSCSPVPFRGINDNTPSMMSHMVQLTYYIPGDRRIVNGQPIDH